MYFMLKINMNKMKEVNDHNTLNIDETLWAMSSFGFPGLYKLYD
jgi:hypothetical protein